MKLKVLSLAFVLIIVFASSPLSVEAQTHSLEWGVDVGEEFTYVLQRAYFADPAYTAFIFETAPFVLSMVEGEKYILTVTDLDAIPTLINESSVVPESLCNLNPVNNSLSNIDALEDFIYPVGDMHETLIICEVKTKKCSNCPTII